MYFGGKKRFTRGKELIIAHPLPLVLQTVDMHREKVARREIGAFTTAKRVPRSHKIIPPATGKEPKPKYTRSPIAYSDLDTLGHGMKVRLSVQVQAQLLTCFTSHSQDIKKAKGANTFPARVLLYSYRTVHYCMLQSIFNSNAGNY